MDSYAVIDKNLIDEAHKFGVVKPNEYQAIRNNFIAREIYLRAENLSLSLDKFIDVLKGNNIIEEFYLKETGIFHVREAIINLAHTQPEKLLIDQDDITLLCLSDIAYNKALNVRDLGDLNKSKYVVGNIYATKNTIRDLEYLLKYKKGMWDLLNNLKENNEGDN